MNIGQVLFIILLIIVIILFFCKSKIHKKLDLKKENKTFLELVNLLIGLVAIYFILQPFFCNNRNNNNVRISKNDSIKNVSTISKDKSIKDSTIKIDSITKAKSQKDFIKKAKEDSIADVIAKTKDDSIVNIKINKYNEFISTLNHIENKHKVLLKQAYLADNCDERIKIDNKLIEIYNNLRILNNDLYIKKSKIELDNSYIDNSINTLKNEIRNCTNK
jgi:hypothetical protein